MLDKASLSVAIIAILIGAGSFAYTASTISGISSQVTQARTDVSTQITQVNSKISPLETSLNTVRQEQTAIRGLVDQRIGGLEKALQEAQQQLAEAQKASQQAQKELEALKADQALEEAAKKEQAPLIYGVIDAPDFSGIVWPRFRESYPWAPAQGRYIEGFAPLRARFASEYQANAPTADILWQSIGAMVAELQPYVTQYPEMKFKGLYPDAMMYPNRDQPTLYVTHLLPAVIIYNSNLLKPEDAPKGWLDLANPKWKDKIAMQTIRSAGAPTKLLADLQPVLGQERWDTFMKALIANNPVQTGSSTEAFVKIVAGEFPVGIGLLNDVIRQPAGSPIRVAWPQEDPKVVPVGDATTIGINNKAANPNFAKLFIQWLESPLGQRAIAETGRPPALLTIDHPIAIGKVLPQDLTILPGNDDYLKNAQKWADLFRTYAG